MHGGGIIAAGSALDPGGGCPFYVALTGSVEALTGGLQFALPVGINLAGTVLWTASGTNAFVRTLSPRVLEP